MPLFIMTPGGQREMTAQEEADFLAIQNQVQVPFSVTMRQARLALLNANHLTAVETFIAAQSANTQIYWQTSVTVRRDHPIVETVRQHLTLTEAQMDALFVQAATYEE